MSDVHSNGIESVWSLFRRSIVGTSHKMSAKHMDRYLEEREWRVNSHDNPHTFRNAPTPIKSMGNLTYCELVA